MLLSFKIHTHDGDGERITLNVLLIESLKELVLGSDPVVSVVMESGDRWRICDPDRNAVQKIVEAQMAAMGEGDSWRDDDFVTLTNDEEE